MYSQMIYYPSNEDDIILDMSKFKHIKMDIDTVTVGSGVTMYELYSFLSSYGYTIPGGTCGTVCIGGLVLGGGLSQLMRLYGVTCESLLDARIILMSGELVQASSSPDLMWMIRGAGQGIVIATEFKLKVYRILSLFHPCNMDKMVLIDMMPNRNASVPMSFPHSEARYSYQFLGSSLSWVEEAYHTMKSYTCGAYIGYPNVIQGIDDYFLCNTKRVLDGMAELAT